MKKIISIILAFSIALSLFTFSSFSALSASKTYAEDKLVDIQKTSGFIPGKDAKVLGNCYGFISAVCEKLYGVAYQEGLYNNYLVKHQTGNYKTVATFTTSHTTPTAEDVENIIAFFLKNAAPGDIVHYGAYDQSKSKTHTIMIQSISNEKMSIYHSNYQIAQNSRSSCHVDNIYWDSYRKNPTQTIKNADGTLYSLNAMLYNTMKVGGVGITINRYKKYEDKFYLVGAAVPAVTTERTSTTSIRLKWDEIVGAKKYRVQYKKSGESSFTTVTENCTELTYNITGLTVGTKYDFRVAAYIGTKWMKDSDTITRQALPPTLTVIKFTPESNGLKLSWTKRNDITGIRIYKGESASGVSTKALKTITDNSVGTYTDTKITYGKTYYYKIERYVKSGKTEYKTTSAAVAGAYTLSKPSITYETVNATSVKISLSENGKNDAFNYYLTDSKGKNAVPLTKTTDTEITINSLKPGEKYSFFCRQSTILGSGDYESLSFTAIPKKEEITSVSASSDGVVVKFSVCEDVDGYSIYRSTVENSKFTLVGSVENSAEGEYTDATVKYNTAYFYKVRSYVNADKENVYSEYSDPSGSVKITLSKPTSFSVTRKTPTSVTLKWEKVENADKYIVAYKAEGDKSSKELEAVSSNSKVISGLKLGKVYYYKVKAANSIGSGSYTAQISKKALPPTPAAPTLKKVSGGIKVSWKVKDWTTGYKIYRATSKNGKYTLIKTITKPTTASYTDKKVNKNKGYYYKAVCYVTKNGKNYDSPKSPYAYLKYN